MNTLHLDHLYTPVTFSDGSQAAGIYIYSNYPDYTNVEAQGEGFSCVDDVSRAALVYLRSKRFISDTATQSKLYHLIRFILEMQSSNGYFYNFLSANGQINTYGPTSIDNANWWSWRALQALSESAPLISNKNPALYGNVVASMAKLVTQIKADLVNLPETTTVINGVTIPQWLPSGSGTDQAATLILGLIEYCRITNDTTMTSFIRKLADGMLLMQQGNSTQFPYDAFLSWENTWHGYGNLQAYSLMKASVFLNDPMYDSVAIREIDNFYPWLLQSGFECTFSVRGVSGVDQLISETAYPQIAYGIEPMLFAASEAYSQTGNKKYADIGGHLAAWFLGANPANINMYSTSTGICFDGISSPGSVNQNSGGESTIEALLTMERVENYPAIKIALNKYKKP
ncbi:MAG: hypothetical protein Q8932_00345 [Bacteroidota bacterium]|nr:hypothetical protein [Bacteroidota bacterium]